MKKYLIIVIIVALYISLAMFLPDILDNKDYLFVGGNAKWIYDEGKWSNMTEFTKNLGIFDIYDGIEAKKLGQTTLYYEDKEIVAKNKEMFNDMFVLAYKGKKKMSIISYKTVSNISDKEIKSVLNSLGIKNTDTPLASKIVIDLDNDGVDETIYEIYNSIVYSPDINLYYSLICVKDGSKYTKLAYYEDNYSFYDKYSMASIIDFTNDGNYEIIISKSGISFNAADTTYTMFGIKDGKYTKLISTE